jgi:hypothetical protein
MNGLTKRVPFPDTFDMLAFRCEGRQKRKVRFRDRRDLDRMLWNMSRKYTPAEFLQSATGLENYLHDLLGGIRSWKDGEEESQDEKKSLK